MSWRGSTPRSGPAPFPFLPDNPGAGRPEGPDPNCQFWRIAGARAFSSEGNDCSAYYFVGIEVLACSLAA